jgi:ribosome assembly protein YihI (activator of Der GTPase)
MAMEKSKRNDKINALINKMDTFEEMEYENSAYFDEEYAEMDFSMEELFDMLEDNADRLDEVQ